MMSMPVVLAAGVAAACVAASFISARRGGGDDADADDVLLTPEEREAAAKGGWRRPLRAGLLTALPAVLMISFLVFPMVSSLPQCRAPPTSSPALSRLGARARGPISRGEPSHLAP